MRLFELYKPLTEEQKYTKWHTLFESAMQIFEDMEWEPQPEFRGVKGTTTATGTGEKAAKEAKIKARQAKVSKHWKYLISKLNLTSGKEKHNYIEDLQKFADTAAKMGLTLEPSISNVLSNLRSM